MPPAVLQFLQATQAVQQRLLRPALPLRGSAALLLQTLLRHRSSGTTTLADRVLQVPFKVFLNLRVFQTVNSVGTEASLTQRAGFGSPADSVNLNHQSSSTSESASAAETAAKEGSKWG